MAMVTYNNSNLTLDQIKDLGLVLFTVMSNWRKRHITVYAHPSLENHLITIGIDFDGSKRVIASEPSSAWQYQLDQASYGQLNFVTN